MIIDAWSTATAWVGTHPGWVVAIAVTLAVWQVVSAAMYPSTSRETRGVEATLLVLVETGLVAYDHEAHCWTVSDRLGRAQPVPRVMDEVMREHGSGSLFARQYGASTHDPAKLTDEGHEALVREQRAGEPGRIERVREMWP